jgi:microcystin-dependent protein
MAQLSSLPAALTAGASENIADVVTNLEALRTAVNGIDADQINAGAVGLSELAAGITNALVPIGTVIDWYPPASAAAPWTSAMPTGFALCDGTAWSSIVNDLGFTTGNIPNLVGAIISGATAASALGAANGVGGVRGSSSRTITTAQMPSHNHSVDGAGGHGHSGTTGGDNWTNGGSGTAQYVGADGNNVYNAWSGNDTQAYNGYTSVRHIYKTHTHGFSTSGGSDGHHSHTGGYAGSGAAIDVTPATTGLLKIMKVRSAA